MRASVLDLTPTSIDSCLCVLHRQTRDAASSSSRVHKPTDVKQSRRNRRFTPVTRQLCLQHHACGFGYKRISKATGIPISTIKYHVRKERDAASALTEHSSAADVDDSPSACADPPAAASGSDAATHSELHGESCSFDRSVTLVSMLHAVRSVIKKNVYAFARALQHDAHGAPSLMRAADPHLLTLALSMLVQDEYAEHDDIAALATVLRQRLVSAQDFVRAALSLCTTALAGASAPAPAASSPSPAPTAPTYWECPVCTKRLIHTGKSAHLARCLAKCKVVLSHEQLYAARSAAATAVAQSSAPDELKSAVKSALALLKADDKCRQVRYMQLVVAANAALQQDLEAAPSAILASRELWHTVQAGPNPVTAALALVSLALSLQSRADSERQQHQQTAARVRQRANELARTLAEQIAGVDAVLARCAAAETRSSECAQHSMQQTSVPIAAPRCTCYRVRISALIHT